MTVTVIHDDSRKALKRLKANSVDACCTDPPYALESIVKRFGGPNAKAATGRFYKRAAKGFMGQQWDTGETAFDPKFWRAVYRVLKPGAFLIAFGGTRTYHRLATSIEDAGFEIRDMLAWLYGSGMPKTSKDVARAIDQHFGVKGHRPRNGRDGEATAGQRYAEQGATDFAMTPGTRGGGGEFYQAAHPDAVEWEGYGTALKPALEPIVFARKPLSETTLAKNVLLHRTGGIHIALSKIGAALVKTNAKGPKDSFGRQGGGDPSGFKGMDESAPRSGRWPANVQHDGSQEVVEAFPEVADSSVGIKGVNGSFSVAHGGFAPDPTERGYTDTGRASRFFYSAKADSEDRMGSDHPTVKPVDLMRHYVGLITPHGGTVLDPFAGTGSTGLAALGVGRDAILIEREASYVADIERRLAWARGEGRLTAIEAARDLDADKAAGADLPLFGVAV